MSTTSPVISLDAEASRFSLPCSVARASGENASAEMNPAATATFKLLGIVELNIHETSARNSRWSIPAPLTAFIRSRKIPVIPSVVEESLFFFVMPQNGNSKRCLDFARDDKFSNNKTWATYRFFGSKIAVTTFAFQSIPRIVRKNSSRRAVQAQPPDDIAH